MDKISIEDRAKLAWEKIRPVLVEYKLEMGHRAILKSDGTIGSELVWVDATKLKTEGTRPAEIINNHGEGSTPSTPGTPETVL